MGGVCSPVAPGTRKKGGIVVGWAGRGSGHVAGTGDAGPGALHDMEVDHGGGYVGVAEGRLHGPDVDAALKKVGGEAMSAMAGAPRFTASTQTFIRVNS